MANPKKKESPTDGRFDYLDDEQSRSHSRESAVYQIKHPNGQIETGLKLADIDRRIRQKQLTGVEWISRGPGHKWTRLSEDKEFCNLILYGLEEGHFQGAPKRSGKRFTSGTQGASASENLPPPHPFEKEKTQIFKRGEIELEDNPNSEAIQVDQIPQDQERMSSSGVFAQPLDVDRIPLQEGELRKRLVRVAIACAVVLFCAYMFMHPELIVKQKESTAPPTWQAIVVNTTPPVPENPDEEKKHKLYDEAQEYYYRDTSYFYRMALAKFKEALVVDVNNGVIISDIIETYLQLKTFALDKSTYFRSLHEIVDRALAKDPYSGHLRRAKAHIFFDEGNIEGATSEIDRANAVDHQNPRSLFVAAKIAWSGGFSGEADKLFTAAFRRIEILVGDGQPYFTEFHVEYGKFLLELDRAAQARIQANIALASNPIHPGVYLLLAQILSHDHKYDAALPEIDKAASLSFFGNYELVAAIRYERALILEKLNEIERAKLEFQLAALLDPDNKIYSEALSNHGLSRLSIPRWKQIEAFSDASYFVQVGKAALEKGQLTEARMQFDIAKNMQPDRADIYYYLGKIIEATNDYTQQDQALEAYKKTVELNPGHLEAHVRLGDLYRRYYFFDEAFEHLSKALKIHEENADANFYMGRYWEEKANGSEELLRKAVMYYDNARNASPDHREAILHIATLAEKMGEFKSAETYFKRYLTYFPHDLEFKVRLHVNHALQGRKAQAIIQLRKMYQEGESPMVQGGIGLSYIASKEYQRGFSFLQPAVERDPKNKWLRKKYAESLVAAGGTANLIEAAKQYKYLTYIDSTDASGVFMAGKILYDENKLQGALVEFENVESINHRYPMIHAYLADIYMKLNQPEKAIIALKNEIQKNPKMVEHRVKLADFLLQQGFLEDAAGVLLKALEVDPKNVQVMYLMARVRREQGAQEMKNGFGHEKLESALKFARLGLQTDSTASKFYLEKGLIYKLMGNTQAARENLRTYLDMNPQAFDRNSVIKIMNDLE